MDGSAQIPVEPQHDILVEVTQKVLRLEKPDTGERRAARQGDTLLGKRYVIDSEAWIIFTDGYGIREHRLKEAWDDLAVEAYVFTDEGGNEELFT